MTLITVALMLQSLEPNMAVVEVLHTVVVQVIVTFAATWVAVVDAESVTMPLGTMVDCSRNRF